MQKNTSVAVVVLVAVVVGLLAAFLYKPILNHLVLGLDLQGGLHVVLQAKEAEDGQVTEDTLQKAIAILRNRVDALQVTEPILYSEGSDRIVVEIAGVDDPNMAVNILKSTARLEFMSRENSDDPDDIGKIWLTGDHLTDARAILENNSTNNYSVSLEFDEEGGQLFYEATSTILQYTNDYDRKLYIVVDGEVISAPGVNVAISGGKAVIEGSFTADEANALAIQLRSGALPVSLEILQSNLVGPTLGSDSLQSSVIAAILGLIAILIFMLGFYRLPGLIADISLVVYSILVLGTMVLMGATLTLPGIAGVALSIGMAVDANIIIYERVKDELRMGKTLKASIESGFKRAFWTIFDANLTTLIAAMVLLYFGSGPVKGFAVTLSIGIVASMLTALIFTRYLLIWSANFAGNKWLYGVKEDKA